MPWKCDADLRGGVYREERDIWVDIVYILYWATVEAISECLK